ncbi:hypothetical protein WME89_26155 [Sorangium sp. So ce321]|uniref:hypothetical protein n=1 Tax=Sorangium sp. So ce321 TaxID=3133300 RepID=UPI003F600DB7
MPPPEAKPSAPAAEVRRPGPPHLATVLQPKPAFGAPAARPPHPATVASPARPPHPATVVQKKPAFGAPAARPPHPATVVQKKAAFRAPAAIMQRRETPFGAPSVLPTHPATVIQRSSSSSSSSSSVSDPSSLRPSFWRRFLEENQDVADSVNIWLDRLPTSPDEDVPTYDLKKWLEDPMLGNKLLLRPLTWSEDEIAFDKQQKKVINEYCEGLLATYSKDVDAYNKDRVKEAVETAVNVLGGEYGYQLSGNKRPAVLRFLELVETAGKKRYPLEDVPFVKSLVTNAINLYLMGVSGSDDADKSAYVTLRR